MFVSYSAQQPTDCNKAACIIAIKALEDSVAMSNLAAIVPSLCPASHVACSTKPRVSAFVHVSQCLATFMIQQKAED